MDLSFVSGCDGPRKQRAARVYYTFTPKCSRHTLRATRADFCTKFRCICVRRPTRDAIWRRQIARNPVEFLGMPNVRATSLVYLLDPMAKNSTLVGQPRLTNRFLFQARFLRRLGNRVAPRSLLNKAMQQNGLAVQQQGSKHTSSPPSV